MRPADKGSGIVILDKDDYINKLQKEMNERTAYLETNFTEETMKKVKKLVNKMHKEGVFGKEMHQYHIPKRPSTGKFKGNPNLHTGNAPLMTIISGINTPTEILADFTEHELNE